MTIAELDTEAPGTVDGRQLRAVAFHRVRMEYVDGVLARTGTAPAGLRAAVLGGGRGAVALGLARLGMDVVSVDPSPAATAMARAAVARAGLPVEARTAPAEAPGLPEGGFDLVYVADTFEVAGDLDAVAASAARLLAPRGTLVYDTVNRTWVSRLIYLGAFQAVPMTRIMPAGRYARERLRPPAEVEVALAAHGLRVEDVCSFKPTRALDLVTAALARRRGRIGDEEIPGRVEFVLDPKGAPVVTYLGYARGVTG
ncbi:hypothetical protein GCM10009678_47080 [Actinomadura kijaniata]|uniref:2-polyprenyl-6-hydroxyphenyl methylase/3-demethylubiquinone-9 3-methyltransferase n=1 Tax=Actinomadura namibiensis TaxID=182080 RepID=A0A7W3LKU2_ACTNM|nr:methyltransferase domain-containing protein [Actinomadura namibiensis]MBA8949981.1 2-polyprenyl-6-hydroxyphenyl methylase/3-demethylubiquinone-9 3-methyltransferase [Actinomadura namibiensis]